MDNTRWQRRHKHDSNQNTTVRHLFLSGFQFFAYSLQLIAFSLLVSFLCALCAFAVHLLFLFFFSGYFFI